MDAPRGIGFDLDHTLAIDNRLERVAFLRLLEIVLLRGGRTIGTLADEIDAIDALLARQRHGEFGIDEAVELFVTERGLECTDWYVEWFRRTAVEMVEEFVVALPGVKPAIEALHSRGIVTAVLTNGWNPLQRRKAEQAGFRGPILVSSEIGVRKPAVGAFGRLLETLGTQAHESWYVGDDPYSDVAGAREAGLQTVWINWERQTFPAALAPPQYTIRSFAELLELLPECVRAS
jgi:HAD superfamily hydrolase (TIGR01509 family)